MEHRAGSYIFGLILVSWVPKAAFGQSSNCLPLAPYVASTSYNQTVTSPNYPLNYDNNLDCAWLIQVNNIIPSLHILLVKVTFDDFLLGYDTGPCKDVLRFYDGSGSDSNLLGSYCGTTPPEVIFSTGKHLYVTFHTDSFITYTGFSFRFSAVKEAKASGICRPFDWKDRRLTGSSGTFFTPDYPFPYPSGSACVWIISVPEGKAVKLTFENFHIETDTPNCTTSSNPKDYVQIRDGESKDSERLDVACGYGGALPPVVYSTGRFLRVRFSSTSLGSWQRSKGFKAHFKAIDPDYTKVCFPGNAYNIDLQLTGYNGTLRSPLSPDWYPAGLSCYWLITVPEEKTVKLWFDSFELEPSSGCTADYVEILDGKRHYSRSIGKFCGSTTPEDIHSSGRYMQVQFRADLDNSHYGGFTATFTAEGKPSKVTPMPSDKPITARTPTANDLSGSSSKTWVIAVVVGVVVFIVLVSCFVLIAMRNKTPNRAVDTAMPMSSSSHATGVIQHQPSPHIQPSSQPVANPYQAPPMDYAPAPTNLSLGDAANPYAPELPPPYPGDGTALQYPPPGQSYPWLQRAPVKVSAPSGSS